MATAAVALFTNETLNEVFENYYANIPKNFNYFIKKSSSGCATFSLTVSSINENERKCYYLVKIKSKKEAALAEILKKKDNVFIVQDKFNDNYIGIEKGKLLCLSQNNLEEIKWMLKILAEYQAANISTTQSNQYDIVEHSKSVLSLEFFKAFDSGKIAESLATLQKLVNHLFDYSSSVKSNGYLAMKHIFIKPNGGCLFLDVEEEKNMPPVYDALLFIFSLTNRKFRQQYLEELLNYYHQQLNKYIKELGDIDDLKLDQFSFYRQVKILLPIVKFKLATYYLLTVDNVAVGDTRLNEVLESIGHFLKTPQLNEEDCLQAVSNKIRSNDFELINFDLLPLEANGHLGEYFKLKSVIKHHGKIDEYFMFTKLLNPTNEDLFKIVQAGPSKKEDFFYTYLIPLAKKLGYGPLTDFAPNYYFGRTNDVVIMEDLAHLGYKNFNQMNQLHLHDLRSIFSNCAKLHALGFLLERSLSEKTGRTIKLNNLYEEYFDDFAFTVREGYPIMPIAPIYAQTGLLKMIDIFPDILKETSIEDFRSKVNSLAEDLHKYKNVSDKFSNTLVHGDFYYSNCLIKYNENNIPTDSFIVDFQFLRYAPPVQDLLFFLYTSVSKKIRDKYMHILLNEYYQNLKKNLANFDMDISTVLTPEQYEESITFLRPYEIIAAIFYAQIVNAPSKEKHELFFDNENYKYYMIENRGDYIDHMFSKSEEFKNISKDLVEDLYNACTK